jgi:7-cyano-7-deazaguanine synthase
MSVVVLFSGGLDSTALLAWSCDLYREVYAVTFDYGQKNRQELCAAQKIAAKLDLEEHRLVDISQLRPLLGGSSLTDDRIAAPTDPEHIEDVAVPMRNLILVAIAAGWAASLEADCLLLGFLRGAAGMNSGLADTSREFLRKADAVVRAADYGEVRVFAPFEYWGMNKADAILKGVSVNAPLHLSWSCFEEGEKHCGRCVTCRERKAAFKKALVEDPTKYAA